MNHFMLPEPGSREAAAEPSRFGVHAMERLIGEIQKLGGERRRLEAKVFGGGHVLDLPEAPHSVANRNIDFIREFLLMEQIPLISHDLGGMQARQILFRTDSGGVLLKRLGRRAGVERIVERERRAPAPIPSYGAITLFDDEPTGDEGKGQ
jgi:chemotaxis protein CheD